jgi:hypothetical protein
MSVLPAGQPLDRVIPDLDDLLHDPASYLASSPVLIGPRRMYGLAALFGIAGFGFLAACFWTGQWKDEKLLLGTGLFLGASVWLGWSLMMRGHALVLHRDGVEVKYRDTSVWCPWALFNADGAPFVPEGDSPSLGLILPIAADAVPFVELRRHDACVAHGAQIKARQLLFPSGHEVVLPARYEVSAEELGHLLLQLGVRLGRELPRGLPPPEAYQTAEVRYEEPDGGGWITVPLTRLVFPPVCCGCGEPTTTPMRFVVQGRYDWMQGFVLHDNRPLEVFIPTCEACQEAMRQQHVQGSIKGLVLGLFVGLGSTAFLLWEKKEWARPGVMIPLGLALSVVGALLGFAAGAALGRRPPAQLRNYAPGRGVIAVRFRNPEYAGQVLAAMRERERMDKQGLA